MATYREAGVNIDAGDELVRRIKPLVRRTFTPGVLTDIGAFGSFFALDLSAYEAPVLVSSVDGVGTKLKVAFRTGVHDTIGQCLVNHCVNDIAVCGAVPLYFLDYFSTGVLRLHEAEAVIRGLAHACEANGCALVGGETAEMPDLYAEGEYDLAGTVVGVVDKARILDRDRVEAGQVLVGLPSTGLHTNGYSLARKVLYAHFQDADRPAELGGGRVGETLLQVHRSYLSAIQALTDRDLARTFVHVTGGGIPGNTARVLPDGLTAQVDYTAWVRPPIFQLIQRLGEVPEEDMRRTFNLGVGLIAVVRPGDLEEVLATWHAHGEEPIVIGQVAAA
ncbi:MAG: phosphoribosylformylglycinamidine cyclo-ligase [Bacteroidota bacterium]